MTFHKTVLILSLFFLTGCIGNLVEGEKMQGQINVFGVALFSPVDYKEINGVTATEEPCLRGYDRMFDALDITVGYGFDKRIRKIITRNPGTSLFGVSPGMAFEEGRQKLLQAGFTELTPPFAFKTDKYSLILLVDGNQKIFGVKVELLD